MEVYEYLKERFKLITREEYRNYDLSINTKKILCDIGLPYEPLNFVQFNIEEIEDIKLNKEYIIIGNDLGTCICINHKDEIVSVDTENEYPIRFINKDLETFLKCIVIYISHENEIENADDDEIEQVMQNIRTEFDLVDSRALNREENWWSVILEQIELGLM